MLCGLLINWRLRAVTISVTVNTKVITIHDASVKFYDGKVMIFAHKREDLVIDCVKKGLPFFTNGNSLIMSVAIMDIYSMDVE